MSFSWLALDTFLTRIRPHRRWFALAIDGVVIALCWNATYLFRLGFERWVSARPAYDGWVLLGLVAIYLGVFVAFAVPRGMWRFTGFGDIKRLSLACALAGVIGAAAVMGLGLRGVPRAVLALHPIVALMGLTLVRIAYRMLYEHMRSRITGSATETRRALILGAGGAARRLIAGIQHDGWVIVGLLDDDPAKQGARIGGIPVLGTLDSVAQHVEMHGITHLIVAMPTATRAQRRRAIDLVLPTRLPVLTVPGAQELQEGTRQRLRDIEPEDLLGREPVQLDEAGIAGCLRGKTVFVTGAGGSIGAELCRQVARYGPRRLVLYELGEFNLYAIEQDLGERFPQLPLVRLVGDVRDLEHVRSAMTTWQPDVVVPAAAYKPVPLLADLNAWSALQNNVRGTYHAALAAAGAGAERFVLISTDKAVNPTNVMGASKRAAEMLLSHLAAEGRPTRFVAVRFGNVLGSSGSVIPKFKEQIARGGPVTVTHPEITRYFMTIAEAARLVLQATAMARNGEVYVLDMGEPVRIVDLARDLIRLSGHDEADIPIRFSGLRPGEKLYEELLADADRTVASAHPRLRVAQLQEPASDAWFDGLLGWLASGPADADPAQLRRQLAQFVPEYCPPSDATAAATSAS
jgi:FlaA1/EpsC-like NDP-sugar epimerase